MRMNHKGLALLISTVSASLWAGCEAPHESVDAIIIRQRTAMRRLPEEDRARLLTEQTVVETPLDAEFIPPGPLPLDEARRVALKTNPDIHAARARLEEALARIAEARSFYFPTLAFSHASNRTFQSPNRRAEYKYSGDSDQALPSNPNLTDLLNFGTSYLTRQPLTFETGDQNPFSDHRTVLSTTWTLFDSYVREARLMSAKHSQRASAMGLADAERLLIQAIDAAYYQVQLGQERLRIARADEEFSQQQLADAQRRYEAQKITKAGVLNFEVRVRAAQARVVVARGIIDTGRVILAELMGLPEALLPAAVTITSLSPETQEEMTAPDVEAWISQALDARPDLAQIEHILSARAENILLAKGQFGPELNLAGSWGFERLDNVAYTQEDQSSSMGIEFRWPIFTGGFRTSQVRRAQAQWWEAAATAQRIKLQVSSEVRRTVVDLTNAQEQVRLQGLNLKSATENRRIVRTEYAAGKASLVRLNEAQRDLVDTEGELARARVRLRQAWSDLDAAASAYRRGDALDARDEIAPATQAAP